LLSGYKDVLKMVLSSKSTLLILAFMVLTNIWALAIGNFFSLYVSENLKVSQQMIPIFPMVRAALMLVILMTMQSPLNRLPLRPVLLTGLVLYILSHVLLVLAPAQNLAMLFGYVLLEGLAFSMVQPRRDSMLVWFVDEKQRARINAIIYVIMIGLTSPFGAMIGWLSGIDRRLPFVFNIGLFLLAILMIGVSKTLGQPVHAGQPASAASDGEVAAES
jgi:Na+/melibiose symporter-like transporter